jgi:hypothetical protein
VRIVLAGVGGFLLGTHVVLLENAHFGWAVAALTLGVTCVAHSAALLVHR